MRIMRTANVGVTLLILVAVVCLCVLPAFDLDPTALRASQHADKIFWGIAASATVLSGLSSQKERAVAALVDHAAAPSDVTSLTCIRLC